jgi:hypothetical protein
MPASAAQIAANRLNAKKSCGPKTQDGKNRSRRNALKHGLTGEGVALPTEDAVEVGRRFEALQSELSPKTVMGELLVRRVAFLSVRLERCEKHDTAVLSNRVRHAEKEFVDRRMVEVEALVARLPLEAATSARRLRGTPEGVDWLVGELLVLKGDLIQVERECWTPNHRARLQMVLGQHPADYRINRIIALSDALLGYFGHLNSSDGEGLEGQARSDWARREIASMIDSEIARLGEVRSSLDPLALEQDRAQAADRALFDPSPEMILARKYEAATERGLYRALKELREVEAAASEPDETELNPCPEECCEELASSGNEDQDEESDPEPAAVAVPRAVDPIPFSAHFPVVGGSEDGPRSLGFAGNGIC